MSFDVEDYRYVHETQAICVEKGGHCNTNTTDDKDHQSHRICCHCGFRMVPGPLVENT